MNLSTIPNPETEDFHIMHMLLAPSVEVPKWEKSGIARPPAGFEPFVSMEGNEIRIGIRRIGGAKPNADGLGGKTDAELRQMAAMKSIPTTPGMTRTELLELVRGKK